MRNKPNVFVKNGHIYSFDQLLAILSRKIVNPQPHPLPDNQAKYYDFRMNELKNRMLIKHTWSGDDVLGTIRIQTKKLYFHSLNFAELTVWIKGICGILLVL